jgi:hypothetical protein
MSSEFYSVLKAEIESRLKDRAKECVNLEDHQKLLRSQGAARELEQLLAITEQMEHPQEPEKE